ACSTSKCEAFSNCDRLGMCGPNVVLPPPQPPQVQTIPPLVNPVADPTVACNAGISPNQVIYMFGTSDFSPMLKAAQKQLSQRSPPFRAVFQNATSCAGVNSIFVGTNMKDPPMPGKGGWAFYFDDAGNQFNCLIEAPYNSASAGHAVDIGVSNLYAQTCNQNYQPGSAVAEYTGPVVPFVLSVLATSKQVSISTEAAHMIFGLGGKAPPGSGFMDAAPWNDFTQYSVRSGTAGSTVLTSRLIDVPADKFWGVDRLTTDNLRDSLLTATSQDKAVGILSIDYNDKNRDNLRALYLQSRGQLCGYQPDSLPTTYDKINVRDGHYPLWGYVHFFTPLIAGSRSPAASALVLQFGVQRLDQQLVDDIIAASLVPQCAMGVQRSSEIGDFMPKPGFRCGCYFDFKTKQKTTCQVCTSAEQCPSDHPSCNYGYCATN
ncbi:MAG TPA: hypothetical protein VK601_21650, partial [Kofleriaceae bacterium]|nr:hypothetical protein [Kofleriaceae bacterium]